MTLARVVTFEGVDDAHMAELKQNIESGDRPENLPATEIMILHDSDGQKAMAILFFDSEEDYRKGHETLDAMPTGDTPGQRTSVAKYNVAARATG